MLENMNIQRFESINLRIYFKFLVLFLIFITSTTASYLYFTVQRVVVKEPVKIEVEKKSGFELSPLPTLAPNIYNILLLGYGGETHSGGSLTDSLMLVYVDVDRKQAVLIAIPRDIWVALPVGDARVNKKINNAYVLGGGELAKQVVGSVVGLPVKYYVSVNFEKFKEAIDILGGVEINVPVAFDDYWYPVKGLENDVCGKTPEELEAIVATMSGFQGEKQFPCRYEHIHFDKGKVQMDGETALKFVRSRHSAEHGGDFARGERQQALLLGVFDKLVSLGAVDDAVYFFNKLSQTISTDIDERAVKEVIGAIGSPVDYEVSKISLTTENLLQASTGAGEQFILIPKAGIGEWERVHDFIYKQIEEAF
jgi:LCP family protein required for cell wall assembly